MSESTFHDHEMQAETESPSVCSPVRVCPLRALFQKFCTLRNQEDRLVIHQKANLFFDISPKNNPQKKLFHLQAHTDHEIALIDLAAVLSLLLFSITVGKIIKNLCHWLSYKKR